MMNEFEFAAGLVSPLRPADIVGLACALEGQTVWFVFVFV